jgi:hypothetical protein
MDILKPKIFGKFALVFFLLSASWDHGFGLSFTGTELEFAFLPGFNRGFYYSWDAAASGLLEINGCFTLSGGITLGKIRGEAAASVFSAAGYGLPFPFFRPYFPLHLKAAYMYNHAFKVSTHILLPTASLQWRYFGFFLGPALRFTNFDGDSLFEAVPAFLAYLNFYNTERAVSGISLGNIGDFNVRNLGAYSFYLYNRFSIIKRIAITSEMELAVSGNVGHITSVYGIAFKQGVVFTW